MQIIKPFNCIFYQGSRFWTQIEQNNRVRIYKFKSNISRYNSKNVDPGCTTKLYLYDLGKR